jgi:CxxC-x17-CxxC domain-containing protein
MNGEEPRGGDRFENRGPRSFADRDRGPRFDKPMFNAICDECGENCQVPFEPRNGKPVLCSNCFAKKDGGRGPLPPFPPKGPRPEDHLDIKELNEKLDRIIRLLTPNEPENITEKILEKIEATGVKEVVAPKKKAKVAKKKVEVKE